MSDDVFLDELSHLANEGPEAISDWILRAITSREIPLGAKDEEPVVTLARRLASLSNGRLRLEVNRALAHAAATWNFRNCGDDSLFLMATLFQQMESPSVAVVLCERLMAPEHSPLKLRASDAYVDLIISGVCRCAFDLNVQSHLYEIANEPAYQEYAVVIFLSIIKHNIRLTAGIVESVLASARSAIEAGSNPTTTYMIGFDDTLSITDIVLLFEQINARQALEFSACFISYSARFVMDTPDEPDPIAGQFLLDVNTGSRLPIQWAAQIHQGAEEALEHTQNAIMGNLQALGLYEKAMAHG